MLREVRRTVTALSRKDAEQQFYIEELRATFNSLQEERSVYSRFGMRIEDIDLGFHFEPDKAASNARDIFLREAAKAFGGVARSEAMVHKVDHYLDAARALQQSGDQRDIARTRRVPSELRRAGWLAVFRPESSIRLPAPASSGRC